MNYTAQFEAAYGDKLQYAKALLSECVKRGFCPYCCLRFLNWQNISLCAQPIATVIDTIGEILGAKYAYD